MVCTVWYARKYPQGVFTDVFSVAKLARGRTWLAIKPLDLAKDPSGPMIEEYDILLDIIHTT